MHSLLALVADLSSAGAATTEAAAKATNAMREVSFMLLSNDLRFRYFEVGLGGGVSVRYLPLFLTA